MIEIDPTLSTADANRQRGQALNNGCVEASTLEEALRLEKEGIKVVLDRRGDESSAPRYEEKTDFRISSSRPTSSSLSSGSFSPSLRDFGSDRY